MAKQQLQELEAQGHHILYVDEMMTTKSTIPSHEYSLKGRPIEVDYKQYSSLSVATVAAISAKNGVDLVMNFPKSVD